MRAMPDLDGMMTFIWQVTIASLLIPLVMGVLIIGVVVWTIRRNSVPREDPAVAELKARYARGEIELAEFQVRLRALTEEAD